MFIAAGWGGAVWSRSVLTEIQVILVDIFETVEGRFSCRSYLDKPVDPEIIRDLIARAARSASNSNL